MFVNRRFDISAGRGNKRCNSRTVSCNYTDSMHYHSYGYRTPAVDAPEPVVGINDRYDITELQRFESVSFDNILIKHL